MSKKILELSTKKSLYKPVVIKVDGKEYESSMITAELFEKISKLEAKAKKGNFVAIAEQLELVYGIPISIAKQLDLRHVNFDALGIITKAIVTPERIEAKQDSGESKNGERPGERGLVKSSPNSQAHRSKNSSAQI